MLHYDKKTDNRFVISLVLDYDLHHCKGEKLLTYLTLLNECTQEEMEFKKSALIDLNMVLVVITCLGGQFVINCPSAFLKFLKYENEGNFKFLKNLEGDLPGELNIRLLVNHAKPTNTLC